MCLQIPEKRAVTEGRTCNLSQKTLKTLQAARALAICLVVYFHSAFAITKQAGNDGCLPIVGDCGVDIFFILSGYIMCVANEMNYNICEFYQKRIIRVAPLYWVMTCLAALISIAFPSLLSSTRFKLYHFAATLLFLPWPNPASKDVISLTPVIIPGWTLNYEAAFYFLFGLSLSIRNPKKRVGLLLILFVVFCTMVSLIKTVMPTIGFYDPLMMCEFLIGVLIYLMLDKMFVGNPFLAFVCSKNTSSFIIAFAIAITVLVDFIHPPLHRLFFSGFPAAFLIMALIMTERMGAVFVNLLFIRVGDASYSIYLSHVFVITFLRLLSGQFLDIQVRHAYAFQICLLIAMMSSSMICGYVLYRLLEMPLLKGSRNLLNLRYASIN